jgi:hypothetical protein
MDEVESLFPSMVWKGATVYLGICVLSALKGILTGDPNDPTLPILSWETPATHYPEGQSGQMFLYRSMVPKGHELSMDGVMGYDKCVFLRSCPITILQEGEKNPLNSKTIWMSDTPMEWYGMGEFSMRLRGPEVLIGGLGLGLIVWHLSNRHDIKKVVVVERSKDVIKLCKPNLPKNIQVEVVEDDFISAVPKLERSGAKFNSAFVDIWISPTEEWKQVYEDSRMVLEDWYPDIPHYFWGFQQEYEEELLTSVIRRWNKLNSLEKF